ncbi:N-acetylmuramoyl-L-alanine amidase [Clostridium sp. BL-8]|uniref:N-acetylmuramoyl-L-alanine amidase family protein n=1 Tax=Clostridium sp. BL-8 TaxID=349938 RepID=UPI00098CEF86|nr:N-acetylmuramoyl-L-alanine amidase [Clostridium sp. BL-8]OOM79061.1 N-acetylmuramoyl-L-alanine amidase AmiA precursor [Clostridium sp. BL-8]
MKKVLCGALSILILITLFGCSSIMSGNREVKNDNTNSQEENENESVENKTADNSDKIKDEDKTQNNEEQPSAINKKIVVIDPGHSSTGNKEMEKQSPDSDIMKIKDPGGAEGIYTKTPEYVVAMSVSQKLKALLEQHNVTVIMTKTQDADSPGNIERAEIGNDNNADLAIRIHCDSADSESANGASMLTPAPIGYAKDISGISKKYGQIILNDLVATAGMKNRGVVEREDLTGFNWSKVPVVLIEMGFMSNKEEDKLLSDSDYQEKLAEGLCNGILKSLQI